MNKSLDMKTSHLGEARHAKMAATAFPARTLFLMICRKAYCILIGRATALKFKLVPPHINSKLRVNFQLLPGRRMAAAAI
jgi:hypothetical protein